MLVGSCLFRARTSRKLSLSRGNSALFHRALDGHFLIAVNSKCPRWRIARGKSSHQVAVNLILAYLADLPLSSGPFEPVFAFRHILRRNAFTLLLLERFAQVFDSASDKVALCDAKATNHKDIFPSAATSRPNRRSSDSRAQYRPTCRENRRAGVWL